MGIWVILPALTLFSLAALATAVPSLDEITSACMFLKQGDIPADTFQPPAKAIYVATEADSGNDNNSGLSLDAPLLHLHKAIEYANNNAETSFTIYIRRGVHYYKDGVDYEYQRIERGNLYITAYQGENVTIRPYYWPGNPSSSGNERVFEIYGPYENITIGGLKFEGWSAIVTAGLENLTTPALRNLTIKNITATKFTRRDGLPDFLTDFFDTAYLSEDVYGEGKQIFDNPDTAHYQIENLILSNIYVEGVDLLTNIGDENDANVRGLRITHFDAVNPSGQAGNSSSDAFAIVNSAKILIDHCRIENINDDGVDTKGYNVAVVNSFITGTGRNAVKFWRNGEIINTILYNVTQIDDGAIIVEDGPCRIINSVLLHHTVGYAGTYDYNEPTTTTLEIVNSVFGEVQDFYVNTSGLRAHNNRWFDMLNDAPIISGLVNADNADQLNALPNCSGNAMSTNQFMNPAAGDFSLKSGSNWIDAGISAGVRLPSFDYRGHPRIIGNGVDIGPIEYQAPPPPVCFWMLY
jgi:hypothetical protein